MPAISPYIINPIWEQFEALLPERNVDHPLGCHNPRIPDKVVFEKLVQVLVFGCAYERIADEGCSATTLRRRRDEWIASGVMEKLQEIVLDAYDRMIGLDLSDVAVDGCITKAPCGGQKAGRSPVDRGKQGLKRSVVVDANGIPIGAIAAPANRPDSPLLEATLDTMEIVGELPERMSVYLDRGYDSESYPRAPTESRPYPCDLREGQAGSAPSNETLGRRTHEFVDQRAQEVGVVYREEGSSHRLLVRILRGGHNRGKAHQTGLDPLPLGGTTLSPTIAYWRTL